MLIQPKIRGFICTTAHPKGCEQAVKQQIDYVKKNGSVTGPKNVLIIGASTGYGLAARIVAAFGARANTIGVAFEKAADDKRTATAGWYNTAAFEKFAKADGLYAKSVNGDAYSDAIKEEVANLIEKDLKKIDLIIYSLASPRRTHPKTGITSSSTLKPIGKEFTSKTIDAFRNEVKDVTLFPATEEDIQNTITVMGGEDWEMWIDYLSSRGLLAPEMTTVAFSYLGPQLTHDIYKNGTIGKAKEDLKRTADKLAQKYHKAFVSINKAVVTQASAAIPVVPLYISLLFKIMKAKGLHENCIEQMYRLFKDYLLLNHPLDAEGYVRLDDLEMSPEVQAEVSALWPQVTSENLEQLSDVDGYRQDFYRLFGFELPNVDYSMEVDPHVEIDSIKSNS